MKPADSRDGTGHDNRSCSHSVRWAADVEEVNFSENHSTPRFLDAVQHRLRARAVAQGERCESTLRGCESTLREHKRALKSTLRERKRLLKESGMMVSSALGSVHGGLQHASSSTLTTISHSVPGRMLLNLTSPMDQRADSLHKHDHGSHCSDWDYPLDCSAYELRRVMGCGATSEVWQAHCLPLEEDVAVKVVDLEGSGVDPSLFFEEARTMHALSHPALLRHHVAFVHNSSLWVIMPLINAGSCADLLEHVSPLGLPERAVASIMKDVLQGLAYLHGKGFAHRDIKASNILLGTDGYALLGDFTLAATRSQLLLAASPRASVEGGAGSMRSSGSSCLNSSRAGGGGSSVRKRFSLSSSSYSLKPDEEEEEEKEEDVGGGAPRADAQARAGPDDGRGGAACGQQQQQLRCEGEEEEEKGEECVEGRQCSSEFVGTVYFMAPEVIEQAPYDEKADIWSVGMTLIELATGHNPLEGLPMFTAMLRTLHEEPPQLDKDYSRALRQVVHECLQKDPADRPTAQDLLQFSFFKSIAWMSRPVVTRLVAKLPSVQQEQTTSSNDCGDPREHVQEAASAAANALASCFSAWDFGCCGNTANPATLGSSSKQIAAGIGKCIAATGALADAFSGKHIMATATSFRILRPIDEAALAERGSDGGGGSEETAGWVAGGPGTRAGGGGPKEGVGLVAEGGYGTLEGGLRSCEEEALDEMEDMEVDAHIAVEQYTDFLLSHPYFRAGGVKEVYGRNRSSPALVLWLAAWMDMQSRLFGSPLYALQAMQDGWSTKAPRLSSALCKPHPLLLAAHRGDTDLLKVAPCVELSAGPARLDFLSATQPMHAGLGISAARTTAPGRASSGSTAASAAAEAAGAARNMLATLFNKLG